MSKDSADYDIGYGKPPEATRFKKGQSGNPRGRPKKQPKDVAAHMADLLDEKQTVRMNGKAVTMTGNELIARRLMEKALKGDPKAFDKVQQLAAQHAEEKARRDRKARTRDDITIRFVDPAIAREEGFTTAGERTLVEKDGKAIVTECWPGYEPNEEGETDDDLGL